MPMIEFLRPDEDGLPIHINTASIISVQGNGEDDQSLVVCSGFTSHQIVKGWPGAVAARINDAERRAGGDR